MKLLSLLVPFLVLVLGCSSAKQGGPASLSGGNSQDYGGTEISRSRVLAARTELLAALSDLAAGKDTDALCQTSCTTEDDPLVCRAIMGASDEQIAFTRSLILSTLPQAIGFVTEKRSTPVYHISNEPLYLEGRKVTAMTEYGPDGQIFFYEDDVVGASASLLRELFGHEIYHKVPLTVGKYLHDLQVLPPTFPNADGGWEAATLAGACLSTFVDKHRASPVNSYQAAVLADNPYGYWRMNESSGGVVYDHSGHGNHGAYSGAVKLGVPGPLAGNADTAAEFTAAAAGGVNGALTLNLGSSDFFPDAVGMTLEMWVKWSGVVKDAQMGAMIGSAGTGYNLWMNTRLAKQNNPVLGFNSSNSDVLGSGTLDMQDHWVHVVAFFSDARMSGSQLFINGEQASLTQHGSISSSFSSRRLKENLKSTAKEGRPQFKVSGWKLDDRYAFFGAISQVAIYPTALTKEQVTRHYRAGMGQF